jgi:uncharacterized membrane protein YeiB
VEPRARARIAGVDVARGLAVLGMFTAHLGNDDQWRLWNGSSGLEVADGRSAAGFALLAGVSAALLSGGSQPLTGARMRHARVRVLARAALLWPLGALMIALGTPVIVILPSYAVMFAATAGVLTWRPRTLLIAAAAVMAVAPALMLVARDQMATWTRVPQLLDIVVGSHYPAVAWMAYLLVGLAVGRMDLRAPATLRRLLVVGAAAAVVGLAVSAVAMRIVAPEHTFWRALLTTRPHASSGIELLSNIGVVLAVVAGCLWLAGRFPRLMSPLAATGALALTAYCVHLIVIAAIGVRVVFEPSNLRVLAFVAVTMLLTTAWRAALGRGPLERAMHVVSTSVADALVPDGRRPRPTTSGAAGVANVAGATWPAAEAEAVDATAITDEAPAPDR